MRLAAVVLAVVTAASLGLLAGKPHAAAPTERPAVRRGSDRRIGGAEAAL